jgi:hypothetical protein
VKFTASAIFNAIARGSEKELSFRVYARKTNSLSDSIVGTAGWTEITDRIDIENLPDAVSQIEYQQGQFTSDSLTLNAKDIAWLKSNIFNGIGASGGGGGTERLDPDGDVSAGLWTPSAGGTIFGCIADGAAANDADYVFTTTDGSVADAFEVSLSNPSGSLGAGNIVVTVRANDDLEAGSDLILELYQGATQKGTLTVSPTASFSDFTFNVDAATISDPNDLRVRVTMAENFVDVISVSWIKVDVPLITTFKYLELKVEASLKNTSEVIPYFLGFVDMININNQETTDISAFRVATIDEIASRLAGEHVSTQYVEPDLVDNGTNVAGLILTNITGLYVKDANISTKVLKVGVHKVSYQIASGNKQAKLDNGPWLTLSNGDNTIGNVDNSTLDTERLKVYVRSTSNLPAVARSDDVIVVTEGTTLPNQWYARCASRSLLEKIYAQFGLTSVSFDTMEMNTYDGSTRISFLDAPPGDGTPGKKWAIATDGTDLFIGVGNKVYKRTMATGAYTLLATLANSGDRITKLMYNARNGHLWIYYGNNTLGAGKLRRYVIASGNLSAEAVLDATAGNTRPYSVELYDYNYTGSSYHYGVVWTDGDTATAAGKVAEVSGTAADTAGVTLTVSTIFTGTTMGYSGSGNGVQAKFLFVKSNGHVKFVCKTTGDYRHHEIHVNSSNVWVDDGASLAGIPNYSIAAYFPGESRIYYFDSVVDGDVKSHTESSASTTSVLATGGISTIVYLSGPAKVYLTGSDNIIYSIVSNAATILDKPIYTEYLSITYIGSRIYGLEKGGRLFQLATALAFYVEEGVFDAMTVRDALNKVLNASLLIQSISPVKKAVVFRRGDATGAPQTSGNTLSIDVSDAADITEVVNQYPAADLVIVKNAGGQTSYDGTNFDAKVLSDKLSITIDNTLIPSLIIKDVAYYVYQFFKTSRSLKTFPLGLVTLWQYEPLDALAANFSTSKIALSATGPIYKTTLSKDGTMTVEVLL